MQAVLVRGGDLEAPLCHPCSEGLCGTDTGEDEAMAAPRKHTRSNKDERQDISSRINPGVHGNPSCAFARTVPHFLICKPMTFLCASGTITPSMNASTASCTLSGGSRHLGQGVRASRKGKGRLQQVIGGNSAQT